MKILFIGDVFGKSGREAAMNGLARWKADVVIVNAENASHGAGLTPDHAEKLFNAGATVLTLGNHTWDKKETLKILDDPRVLRPANYPPGVPGKGAGVFVVGSHRVGVIQLMGRHHLATIDCPFRAADALLAQMKADVVIVDMHAEATSEKQSLGWYLDGRVSAVIGTHTHVQTADERILPGGTAYLGDAGMTGPRDGVIGADKDAAIRRFVTGLKGHFEPAKGPACFCAALIDIDESTGKARDIKRIFEVME